VEEFMSVKEVAKSLKVSPSLIYGLTRKWRRGEPGGLACLKVGGLIRIPVSALREFSQPAMTPRIPDTTGRPVFEGGQWRLR
jgi:excisionase family DNA binding protein